jgi:hypothetical protein
MDEHNMAQNSPVKKKLKTSASPIKSDSPHSSKALLERPIELREIIVLKKELRHVTCVGDDRAYISGSGNMILLIDRSKSQEPHVTTYGDDGASGSLIDTIPTSGVPSVLGVLKDGSLIYYCGISLQFAIYRFDVDSKEIVTFQSKQSPSLCCTKSGEILVCMNGKSNEDILGDKVFVQTVTVVRYSSSGEKMKEFQILREKESYPEVVGHWPICENVNGDICTGHRRE